MNPADVKVRCYDVFDREVYGGTVTVDADEGPFGQATIDVPGYELERVLLDAKGRPATEVGDVVLTIDPEGARFVDSGHVPVSRKLACARLMRFAAEHLGVIVYQCLRADDDRAYFTCFPDLASHLDRSGVWSRDKNKGRGHTLEPGWEIVGSWRSNTHVVSMQVVVHERWQQDPKTADSDIQVAQHVAELDLDYGGIRHAGQVLGNWVGRKTSHPIEMAQAAVCFWGLRLPFTIDPGGGSR